MEGKKQILELARACLEPEGKGRPENQWLRQVYDRFRARSGGLGKAEADDAIYTKMYGVVPAKPSDTLKIRYWRTGRHVPAGREQCLAFGKALDLSEEEMKFLIQGYYDRCDCVFESEEAGGLYRSRRELMEELIREYLDMAHPALRFKMYRSGAGLEHSLRHLYFTDARSYLEPKMPEFMEVERHIASINYESEFSRQIKMLGEIPRRTMIRHLVIFGMPFVNREILSRRLEDLGYYPLAERHTQTDGSRLDKLVLGFLGLYEEICTGKDPGTCSLWFRRAYQTLDRFLEERGNASLRFLYFKALKYRE